MSDLIQVITTVDAKEKAQALAHELVKLRLAACVQIDGPIESVYRCRTKSSRPRNGDLPSRLAVASSMTSETPFAVAMTMRFLRLWRFPSWRRRKRMRIGSTSKWPTTRCVSPESTRPCTNHAKVISPGPGNFALYAMVRRLTSSSIGPTGESDLAVARKRRLCAAIERC